MPNTNLHSQEINGFDSNSESHRYTLEEMDKAFAEGRPLVGIVKLALYDFRGFVDPELVLLTSLVDGLSRRGISGIYCDYDIISHDDKTICFKVTAKKKTA